MVNNYLFLVLPLINNLLVTLPNSLQLPVDFARMEHPISGFGTGQLKGLNIVLENCLRITFEVGGLNKLGLVKS